MSESDDPIVALVGSAGGLDEIAVVLQDIVAAHATATTERR
jgi:hypothetical protein